MDDDTIHVGPWHAARAMVAPPRGKQLTVVSLFTGIGGFDLGFELTGAMTTIAQVEIDKHCNRVLEKHWPDVARYTDVREFGLRREGGRGELDGGGSDPAVDQPRQIARQLELAPGGIDVICGGFPCQDLSVAGKRAGLDGARSGLWFEFHRILRELRPRWAVIENVPGLLSSDGGRDLRVVLEGLEELYPGAWGLAVLDSQEFGVPQRRRRVFLVAGPSREGVAKVLSLCEGCGGYPEESCQSREEVAGTLGGGAGARGFPLDTDRATFVPGTVGDDGNTYVPDVAYALAARDAKGVSKLEGQTTLVTGTLRGDIPGFRQDDHDTLVLEEVAADAKAYAMQTVFEKANGRGVVPEVAFTIDGASHQAVGVLGGDVAHTLAGEQGFDASEDGTGRGTPVVAIRTSDTKANGVGIQDEAAYTLQQGNGQAVFRPGDEKETAQPITAVYAKGAGAGDRSKGSPQNLLVSTPDVVGPMSANGGTERKHGYGMGQQDYESGYAVPVTDTVVRRLTPIECARLQGFPDDWTCLCDTPSLCKCADGPQYKVYGNAVTVSVLQYLGGRIVAFEREEGRI